MGTASKHHYDAEAGEASSGDDETKGLLSDSDANEYVPWYPCARKYSRRELMADALVLVCGSLFSAVAVPALLVRSVASGNEPLKQVGLAVYCLGLAAMLNFSAAFNRFCWCERWFPVLQLCDMVGIYLMVAGCYTPACFQSHCLVLFGTVWSLAATGVFWQVFNFGVPSAKRYPVDIILFLVMGWVVVIFRHQVSPYVSDWAVHHVLAFGVIFTVGAGFNSWESLRYHKAIWHMCVLVATILTYLVAYREFAEGLPLGTPIVEAAQ